MENCLHRFRLSPAALLLGGALMAGCVNSDYDFNEVDSTMGFGGDGLELPASSTDTIKLADVLDLEDDDCVKVRPNGDYVFEQVGDDVDPVHPEIGQIEVSERQAYSEDLEIKVQQSAKGHTRAVTVQLEAEGQMQSFEYDGDMPEEVLEMKSATTNARFSFNLHFPDEQLSTGTLERITMRFPAYMELTGLSSNGSYTQNGSTLIFTNVSTKHALTLTGSVSKLNFGVPADDCGSIVVNEETRKIDLDGRVRVSLSSMATIDDPSVTQLTLSSDFSLGAFNITSATGRFNPDIDLDDLGDVNITGVPDFLKEDGVDIDLANPQIMLTLNSDLAMDGLVSGTLHSYKNGEEIATVAIPQFAVKAGGETEVLICRTTDGVDMGAYDVVQAVPDLSEAIRTIPDRIEFEADVNANTNSVCTFELGKEYNVQPKYSIEAPIAFAENARIVYKDTLDEWNEDIKDFELTENAYISVKAEIVNHVPAYLNLSAHAIDVNGDEMSDQDIKVEVSNTVVAMGDGENSVNTPLEIKLSQRTAGALAKLDGLVLSIEAAAADDDPSGNSAVVGQTLNSEKHFLVAKDIKIKLVGQLIGDFN